MSGGSVRALTVAINARDRATKIVGNLKADLKKIEGKAVVAQLKANDAASKPIKNVAACLEAADKAAMQAFKSLGHFEKGTSLAERGVSRLRAAMQKANTTIEAYSRNVEKARKSTESLEKLQGAAAGMAAVTGGLIGFSMMTSAGTSKNLQAALNASASEEEAAQIEAWVRGGTSGSRSLRAMAARKGVLGAQGIDALSIGENLEFLDLIVKHGQAGGATEGEIESALEALYTGSPDSINDILGGFEISNDTINKQIETARATEASVWKDYTDEEMTTVFAVREYTRLMKERGEVETDAYTRLQNNLSDIRDNIGEVFGPVVALAAEATGAVAALVTKYPLAKYLIAAGLAVGFMGASILLLLPGLAVATSMITVAGLATAGWAVLLLALAGVLASVAKKTGILSKAWEMITGAWDSLQETDMGDLGKLALKVVFPPAALAALVKHIPGMQGVMERAERILTNVLDKLGEFKDRALDALRNLIPGWLKSIWSRLKEVFTGFVEAIIKTFGGLMPEGYKEQLEAYTQLQEAAAAGEAGDTAEARRYGILGYDAKDDEYKIANFVPAQ
ncbi:MAG: hypothetical protein QM433_00835, partial [Euryarchaeota archaeon]|nr:hypothetical protein [Euryarchaeota archaeon]